MDHTERWESATFAKAKDAFFRTFVDEWVREYGPCTMTEYEQKALAEKYAQYWGWAALDQAFVKRMRYKMETRHKLEVIGAMVVAQWVESAAA